MRIWWVFSFINCFLLSISAIVCYRFVDWYFVHVIKEFEGELMCGIGLHARNMRSYFQFWSDYYYWLYNCCICIYGVCILKAWQLTREYIHLTFNLEWLQVWLSVHSVDTKWTESTVGLGGAPTQVHRMDLLTVVLLSTMVCWMVAGTHVWI